jgi:DNA primase catalytic core
MSRIPDQLIERIKREIDLRALIESYGVKLKNKGEDLSGLCPLHDDHEPSLIVTPKKNLWNCLGACQTGGTTIDWVMKMEKISFRHAVEILKDRFSISSSGSASPNTTPATNNLFSSAADKQQLLNHVVEFYHKTLKESPDALAYLEKRKLAHPRAIEKFKIGFANRTLGYRLPNKQLKDGELIRGKLQQLGILRESGHEHLAGCVVIPVIDQSGQVQEVYGRRIQEKLRVTNPKHLYLKGQHRGVFNIHAFEASTEIILCEALLDALTLWTHGFMNVTASYGVNGFTDEHLAALKKYQVKKVAIAYDNDVAGNSAAEKLARKLTDEGFVCSWIELPAGMDVNLFAQRSSAPQKDFERLVLSANDIFLSRSGIYKNKKENGAGDEPRETRDNHTAHQPPLPSPIPAPAAPVESPHPHPQVSIIQSDASIPVEVKKEEIIIRLGDRNWRIRGLSCNMSYNHLKVNILICIDEKFFADTLDMYSSRLRSLFCRQAAADLEIKVDIIKNDLGKVFLKLEEFQDKQIKKTLEAKKADVVLTEKEIRESLAFLKDAKLLKRILSDFEKCGVAGEESNKLIGYLAGVSRKLENPLAVIIQSSSAAGKTWLMDSILAFMPGEEKIKYSAMTSQSLYYLGEKDLKHKILAIVEEEGAEKASYALKLLQTEKELVIASTGKDPQTGKLITHEYKVEGPVMIFVTTTRIDIDEELQNRCLVLTVNESRQQTKAIHQLQRQRRTLLGLQAKIDRSSILRLHNNAQRLLRPLAVVNPYAPSLTFLDDRIRARRDHEKYLNLIDAIALLHQHQRPIKRSSVGGQRGRGATNSNSNSNSKSLQSISIEYIEYIEVQLSDIEIANKLANEVLGRSLDDIPPQTKKLLNMICQIVSKESKRLCIEQSDYRFSRRQICDLTHWSMTQVVVHLDRLVVQEYAIVHRGGRGQSFVYELVYRGEGMSGESFLPGLIDVEKLKKLKKHSYDSNLTAFFPGVTGSKRGQNGPKTGGLRSEVSPSLAANGNPLEQSKGKSAENSYIYRENFDNDKELTYRKLSNVNEVNENPGMAKAVPSDRQPQPKGKGLNKSDRPGGQAKGSGRE